MASAAPPRPFAGPPVKSLPSVAPRLHGDPSLLRWLLIAAAMVFLGVMVVLPLASVFGQAFAEGPRRALRALSDRETLSAIKLTLLVAAIVVPCNLVFGVTAAWLIAKHRFFGRSLLLSLIELPLSVSPVISGLIFVLLFGGQSLLGGFLADAGFPVVFALPGIVLATAFVTFPLVVSEVLPVLEASGNAEEEAALTLGAGGWRIFFRITVPKVKWGLLYGVILCNARAMGEFGAVSVVSGHIRGLTNTLPLQVEILYNEYDFVGTFAVASLLTVPALATLVGRKVIELRSRPQPAGDR